MYSFEPCEVDCKFNVYVHSVYAQLVTVRGWVKSEKIIGCHNFGRLLIYLNKNLLLCVLIYT